MSTPFARTLRHLEPRRSGCAVVAMTTVIVTTVWCIWATKASVTVYEVSDRARLEVDRAPHPVDSPVSGTVVESRMQLDRDVAAGDVLVRLDADAERFS